MKNLVFIFLRCAAIFCLLLAAWNAYLLVAGYTSDWNFLEKVVFPSLVTAFALTLTHFLVARVRGVEADFAVRQETQFALPEQSFDISTVAARISKAKNWTLVESRDGEAVFKTPFSLLFSFGEVVRLKLTDNRALVSSKPLLPLTAVDFGQSALNVRAVADLLTRTR